jgi:hypothetical protein
VFSIFEVEITTGAEYWNTTESRCCSKTFVAVALAADPFLTSLPYFAMDCHSVMESNSIILGNTSYMDGYQFKHVYFWRAGGSLLPPQFSLFTFYIPK